MAEVIPGLRPWEVLSVEQAMDQITYGGEWYRSPLSRFTTGPPYLEYWNNDVKVHTCFLHPAFVYNQLRSLELECCIQLSYKGEAHVSLEQSGNQKLWLK